MSPAIIFAVYGLAVARLTRLVTNDKITEAWRGAFIRWTFRRADITYSDNAAGQPERPPPLLAYLIVCPWCVSIYIAAVAAPLAWYWGTRPWLVIPALALAFSYAAGWLAQFGGE